MSVKRVGMLVMACEGMSADCNGKQAEVLTEGVTSCTQTKLVAQKSSQTELFQNKFDITTRLWHICFGCLLYTIVCIYQIF